MFCNLRNNCRIVIIKFNRDTDIINFGDNVYFSIILHVFVLTLTLFNIHFGIDWIKMGNIEPCRFI